MVTIVLIVSRIHFLTKVLSAIELLECDPRETSLLVIVDGDDSLYLRTRNLANDLKFENRLIVKSKLQGMVPRLDVNARRRRIAQHHNQAKDLIDDRTQFVFSVEDDTTFNTNALTQLKKIAISNRAFGMVEGVELGRWGVPYVGAWKADNIYDVQLLTSVQNKYAADLPTMSENIDAGGLYCALIRADLYKLHNFTSANGLGPDVNLGLELRQLGYENFIAWNVPCTHHFEKNGVQGTITPDNQTKIVQLVKENDVKWRVAY